MYDKTFLIAKVYIRSQLLLNQTELCEISLKLILGRLSLLYY